MKSLVKRTAYKTLIISMIMVVLSFFSVSSITQAKLKLQDGEFYYSGTQESSLVVREGLWARIAKFLSEVLDYILGIMTFGIRGIVIGWIEIMELILTALLTPDTHFSEIFENAVIAQEGYSQSVVTIENILFNKVEFLNANIFNMD